LVRDRFVASGSDPFGPDPKPGGGDFRSLQARSRRRGRLPEEVKGSGSPDPCDDGLERVLQSSHPESTNRQFSPDFQGRLLGKAVKCSPFYYNIRPQIGPLFPRLRPTTLDHGGNYYPRASTPRQATAGGQEAMDVAGFSHRKCHRWRRDMSEMEGQRQIFWPR